MEVEKVLTFKPNLHLSSKSGGRFQESLFLHRISMLVSMRGCLLAGEIFGGYPYLSRFLEKVGCVTGDISVILKIYLT